METFKKRQKEMKRLERQRDKAAKRQEIKARKAAGLPAEPDTDTLSDENALTPEKPAESDPAAIVSTLD